MNVKRTRTAKEVIDQAVLENKANERLLYGFAAGFVTVGLSVLALGVLAKTIALAGIGTLTSVLFLPAVAFVRRTRKENIAIRLLEYPLSRADTAKGAAEMLQQLFNEIFRDKEQAELKPLVSIPSIPKHEIAQQKAVKG